VLGALLYIGAALVLLAGYYLRSVYETGRV
jgi:hypothetical protein